MSSPTATTTLDPEYRISPEQAEGYRRNGHVLLRGVASPQELSPYRKAIVDTAVEFRKSRKPLEQRDTYGKAFLQLTNLWELDEQVRRFTLARRFAQVAADLMGVDGVRLYHDQALFKEPGGGRTPWHQDQFYWPLDTDKTITMWMPLSDASADMGTMRFASGSHADGPIERVEISDESDAVFEQEVARRGWTITEPNNMKAGDATFHSGWVLHAAGANPTDNMREAMTIIYYADGARVTEPADSFQEGDLAAWFPGLKPGDAAASEKNPLVFQR